MTRHWPPRWTVPAALAVALASALAGALSDRLTAGDFFNLLSLPLALLLAWNLGVAAWSLAAPRARGFAPEAGALLHVAAAGFGAGFALGLVLRGLVQDFRAGWASTLLTPEQVTVLLRWAYEPAWSLLGRAPPGEAEVAALRVLPGGAATQGAAPWIGLMLVQIGVLVVLPRLLLAARALAQARKPPPAAAPAGAARAAVRYWLLPHGATPAPAALAVLQRRLAETAGGPVAMTVAPPLAWGDEDHPPAVPAGARPVLLVDLAATPEAEVHGRLLRALAAGGARPLVVADAANFARRFADTGRQAGREAAWRAAVAPAELRVERLE